MNKESILQDLEGLLNQLSIELKYRKGYFKGGLCRYRDKDFIYLNRADKPENHIALIIEELSKMNLGDIEIPQSIGELLLNSEASREE
jgi:hypothetical protein